MPYFEFAFTVIFIVALIKGRIIQPTKNFKEALKEALAGDRRRLEVMARLPVPDFPGGARLRQPILVAAMLLARLRDAI